MKHKKCVICLPTVAQTILEDEVDDPVYQVGPADTREKWNEKKKMKRNTADLDAFPASRVLFSLWKLGI